MKRVFAPGCALMLYKPRLAARVHGYLRETFGDMEVWTRCCRKDPEFGDRTEVINVCPGCDKRFRKNYRSSSTISLWEVLADLKGFPFPDYHGKRMSIIDACPTRTRTRVHDAVRTLLGKMNIALVEPKNTRTKSTCCGDIFYGEIPTDEVKERMRKRAGEMPVEDVVVHCVSCVKAMFIGGRKPRYLVDLLFGEETTPGTTDPDEWHKAIDDYIDAH
jgi:Fe-S oxidoreductase